MVKFGKFEVPKAPFEVIVGPRSQSSIVAYGPGLKGGIAGLPASFVVEMNGETGALAFSVAGPSQVKIFFYCKNPCQEQNKLKEISSVQNVEF